MIKLSRKIKFGNMYEITDQLEPIYHQKHLLKETVEECIFVEEIPLQKRRKPMSVSVVLRLYCIRITWKDLLKHRWSTPPPEFLIQWVWGETQECISDKVQGGANDAIWLQHSDSYNLFTIHQNHPFVRHLMNRLFDRPPRAACQLQYSLGSNTVWHRQCDPVSLLGKQENCISPSSCI